MCIRDRRGGAMQLIGFVLLWALLFAFVWFTYRPLHLPLFLDPVSGCYGQMCIRDRHMDASATSIIYSGNPVFAVALAHFILHEPLKKNHLLAIGVELVLSLIHIFSAVSSSARCSSRQRESRKW